MVKIQIHLMKIYLHLKTLVSIHNYVSYMIGVDGEDKFILIGCAKIYIYFLKKC